MENLTTTCETVGDTQTCVTDYSQGFYTSGELVISLQLFIIIIFIIFWSVRSSLNSITIKRKFLGNNSKDGKEIYEI